MKTLLKLFLEGLLNILLGSLKEFVVDTVAKMNMQGLNNDQKRQQAFEAIKVEAQNVGKKMRDSMINLAIELVVTKLKGV